MALAKELMGVGFSAGQASNIGGQYVALTALGTSQATAAPVLASMVVIASADGTKGVTLPACEAGAEIWLFNNSGSTCPVYPDVGAAICVPGTGLGSANTAYSQLTYKTSIYKRVTSTQWLVNTSA
jgi:hypothetical protein